MSITSVCSNIPYVAGLLTLHDGRTIVSQSEQAIKKGEENHSDLFADKKSTARIGDICIISGNSKRSLIKSYEILHTGETLCLHEPFGLAYHEQSECIIIADRAHRILRLNKRGHLSLLAGSAYGYSGFHDGNNGTAARFNAPMYVAVDHAGVIFVSDTGNNAIRRIRVVKRDAAALEVQSTDQSDEEEIIVDTVVGSPEQRGHTDGLLSKAMISSPYAMCITEENNLLFADCYNNAIRMLNARRTHITTIVGGPSQPGMLRMPQALTLDTHQNIIMVDNLGKRIRTMPLITTDTFLAFTPLPTVLCTMIAEYVDQSEEHMIRTLVTGTCSGITYHKYDGTSNYVCDSVKLEMNCEFDVHLDAIKSIEINDKGQLTFTDYVSGCVATLSDQTPVSTVIPGMEQQRKQKQRHRRANLMGNRRGSHAYAYDSQQTVGCGSGCIIS